MSTRTCKVGIHGRNHEDFQDQDFEVIREAHIEAIKMMSQTRPGHFERLKRENPGIELITRLYTGNFGEGHHPSPAEFAGQVIPVMGNLRDFCVKFEVHNEPNHVARYEGWGSSDEDAADFNRWFLEVYDRLKQAHPWASIGFPGLAMPHFGHRDRDWLRICRPAIQRADWLGVHCYWQTPPGGGNYSMDESFGLAFKYYHQQYPNKVLEILECGNSNVQSNYPISEEAVAEEYVQWLQEIFKYPYINSASFFILSSQDTGNWSFFSWRTENFWKKPIVWRVRDMFRPSMTAIQVGAATPATPVKTAEPSKPTTPVSPMPVGLTNQLVINALNRASLQLGLGNWGLLGRAGLNLAQLSANRLAVYAGPGLDQMPALTDQQRALVRAQLPSDVSFGFPTYDAFLARWPDLALAALSLPAELRIRLADTHDALERRVARTWNRFGYMLTVIAEVLGLRLPVTVAVLAAELDRAGIADDGRLAIRFGVDAFFEAWGRAHPEEFGRHFRMDAARPWQAQSFRKDESAAWADVHTTLKSEWSAYEIARTLDPAAAYVATSMGFAGIPGAAYTEAGYESAGQMFDAFSSSERYQVLSYFDLIAGRKANSRGLEALRRDDLDAFATLHRSPREAGRYATTLRRAVGAFEALNPLK